MKNLLVLMLMVPSFLGTTEANLSAITKAIGSGDAQALGQYFDDSIEIGILGNEGFYGKSKAISMVQGFFSKYRPTAFSQVHKGAPPSKDSQYCIGNLTAGGQSFRVYIYMKVSGGKTVIQELKFDKE